MRNLTKKSVFSLLIFILLTSVLFAQKIAGEQEVLQKTTSFVVQNPYQLSSSTLEITGPWDFYWGDFLSEQEFKIPDCRIELPSTWNNYPLSADKNKIAKSGKGSGTYRILVKNLLPDTVYAFKTYDLASTAIEIFVNGQQIFNAGIPQEDWTKTKSNNEMSIATFKSNSKGQALITLWVSNDFYRKGGVWDTLKIAEFEKIRENYERKLGYLCILGGILLTVTLYSMFLFFIKKEKAGLALALFTVSLLIRISATDFPILKQFIPQIPYPVMLRLEYSALVLSPFFYAFYLFSIDERILGKKRMRFISISAIVLSLALIFTPIFITNRLVPVMQIYLGIVILIDLISLSIYFVKFKNFKGIFCFATVFVIFICALNDIIYNSGNGFGILILDSATLPFSFVVFSICQTIVLAVSYFQSEMKVNELNDYLKQTNKAYHRFVPKQLLDLFQKKDITELEIGQNITRNMTILSADIRNFTATSENLTDLQVFEYLNGYFTTIAPIIESHKGIIEKYLGDGIIVLFPENCEEALLCAIEMQEAMVDLRRSYTLKSLPDIRIGIGIHYGNILIGTAGDTARMSEVAISKDLDVLQHVESSTKRYNRSIIVTKEALSAAAWEVKSQNRKFSFYGKKIQEAIGRELFYIYNDNITYTL